MRRHFSIRLWSNAFDAHDARGLPKWALRTRRNNRFGARFPDPRQARQCLGIGYIDVDTCLGVFVRLPDGFIISIWTLRRDCHGDDAFFFSRIRRLAFGFGAWFSTASAVSSRSTMALARSSCAMCQDPVPSYPSPRCVQKHACGSAAVAGIFCIGRSHKHDDS